MTSESTEPTVTPSWSKTHPEQARLASRKYYYAHREELLAKAKLRDRKEAQKKYYARHREELLAKAKARKEAQRLEIEQLRLKVQSLDKQE